jgi:hypothetical protein
MSDVRWTEVQAWARAQWDRIAGVALIVIGALALYLGYHGVSRSAYVAAQMAYVVSGGLGGLFCLGLGAVFLLRGDLHDHWRQLDRIEAAIRREADPTLPPVAEVPSATTPSIAAVTSDTNDAPLASEGVSSNGSKRRAGARRVRVTAAALDQATRPK